MLATRPQGSSYSFIKNVFSFQVLCLTDEGQKKRSVCPGDSGGPVIWDDEKDQDRSYLMGVISQGQGLCFQDPSKKLLPPKAVWVPAVMDWLISIAGKELQSCLISS